VDGWINNAGVLDPIGPLAEQGSDQLQAALSLNVTALALATACFAEHVAHRDGPGVLVNVSSGAASTSYVGWAHYCAAKAFVDRLTEVVELEERDRGLRAFAVAPGVVDTEMQGLIRASSIDDFPAQPRFIDRFEAGELRDPTQVGIELADLVLGVVEPSEVVVRLG
jgi:NAD(P)-dependent dehydrogenase (short-subunit alcohol dehydrogenase family)